MPVKSIIFVFILITAFIIFYFKVLRLIKYLKLAQPENRFDNVKKRILKILSIAFGQSKLLRERVAGSLHFFIFWGFVILLLAILEAIGEGFSGSFSFAFLGPIYSPLLFLEELMGILVILSVVISIFRRLVFVPKRLKVDSRHQLEAILILCWIFFIMFSMFCTYAGRVSDNPNMAIQSRFVSVQLSHLIPLSSAYVTGEIGWWTHIILVLGFLNYLPNSKHLHILTSIPNVYLSNLGIPAVLKPINFEQEGLEKFGAVDVEDFTWKTILDGYTCTECGRCTAACPANITGKVLSPKEIMMKIRERSFLKFPLILETKNAAENKENIQNIGTNLIGNFISEEALWSCTTCMACIQECPVNIEHVIPIVDMRRSLVMMESKFPEELGVTFKNLENNFSPWAFNPSERMNWAEGLPVKTVAENKNVEYLYWVGCTGAFDQRYRKVSRAFTQILNKAGINFGVLGSEEKCNGDAARRAGNEYLAQMLIKENISTLNNYSIKKIITTCPHCYNALKNEYPLFGGDYEVLHHSQFIHKLLVDGKIKLDIPLDKKLVFHDSCYLGRYNQIYDEPRDILKNISGVKLNEFERNRDRGLCCGAGGRMFLEEKAGKKVNVERTEEALTANPDIIASACPFCMTMLTDGLKFKSAEEKVLVKDIAEIVLESDKLKKEGFKLKKNFIFFVVILFGISQLFAQETELKKYWIFFNDKGPGVTEKISLHKGNSLFEIAKSGLSEKTLLRRAKVLPPDNLIDFSDLPVNENYINELKTLGVKPENILKWFNAITAYLSDKDIEKISNMKYIKEIKPVVIFARKNDEIESPNLQIGKVHLFNDIHRLKYGYALNQLEMMNVPKVHDFGINGTGILVGMMDTGFRWKIHNSLKTRKVIKEYDFVFKDSVTANQSADYSSQDNHGTLTFSVLGGYSYDTLIGPAYNSTFILAKTEDIRSETRIEEDNWAAAAEWMEGNGVDVTSTSLGYNEFDNNIGNYTYQDMNGNTAIITKAADLAFTKGVVVINSAGNEGSAAWKYIIAPADGKYVIAVGAVSYTGDVAGFSSVGPTSDGRIKPDVSAPGVNVWGASAGFYNGYSSASGTSLSCPLVGGTAALVLSARPDLTPLQVRDALRNTASQATNPNNSIGWGVIDAYRAVTYYGLVFSNQPQVEVKNGTINISIYLASSYTIDKQSVKLFYVFNGSKSFQTLLMTPDSIVDNTNSGKYTIALPEAGVSNIDFYFVGTDAKGERKHPYTPITLSQKTFSYSISEPINPAEFSLAQNYPNPFNPSTEMIVSLPSTSYFTLEIYNSLGQRVRKLFEGIKSAGRYYFSWDGTNSGGIRLSSGLYYYRIRSDGFSQTKKMLLVK